MAWPMPDAPAVTNTRRSFTEVSTLEVLLADGSPDGAGTNVSGLTVDDQPPSQSRRSALGAQSLAGCLWKVGSLSRGSLTEPSALPAHRANREELRTRHQPKRSGPMRPHRP
jgi:hypothetical protein